MSDMLVSDLLGGDGPDDALAEFELDLRFDDESRVMWPTMQTGAGYYTQCCTASCNGTCGGPTQCRITMGTAAKCAPC